MSEDAHLMCRFGQWYYKIGLETLRAYSGMEEIGTAHQRMHQYAAHLLQSCVDNVPISLRDYERFVSALKSLRLEIATAQHELDDALYNIDPLTSAPSRIGMLTKLREQKELAQRQVHNCAVAMMDLDHFKAVNDIHGHMVGDQVLVGFAHYIMGHLRPYDKLFRFGGEEFLICMPDTDLNEGKTIVERLREELSSLPFKAENGEAFNVTVSFGLTLLDPDEPVEQSIDRADKALYSAKTAGRNRTVVWDASMNGGTEKH